MPTKQARGSSAAAVNEGIIYLAGGMRRLELSGNFTQDTVGTVTAYDTRNGEWKVLPSLPDGRDHAGAAVYGDNFFVVGGRYRGQMNVRGTVFSLSLRRSEKGWSSRSPMPTPRGGLAAGLVGGKLYTFGGEGNPAEGSKGVFNETEAYDVRTDHWMRLPPMPVPRHGTSAVAVNGKIYIPGGGVEQGGGPVAMFDVFVP